MPEHKEHLVSTGTYLGILIALMLLLAITVVMAFINIDHWTAAHHLGSGWNTAIAVTIAFLKGLLILLVFMHLRYGSHLTWVFAAAGFIWLGIMLWLTMTDYFTRY
jgi:cytochrome c oxidase subunit 4